MSPEPSPELVAAVVEALRQDGWQIVKLEDMGDGSGGWVVAHEFGEDD